VQASQLVQHLDEYLRTYDISDKSLNGLQVEGAEEIAKVALAVDASQEAFDQAVASQAQLLVVHHGLFWGQPTPLTGPTFRRVKTLIVGGCGLYASHLPLDIHPEVGNNAELARLLELEDLRPFGRYEGADIGLAGTLVPPLEIPALLGRLIKVLGTPPLRVLAHGPDRAAHIGCITGFAADLAHEAKAAGLDTYITGETSHSHFHSAAELGLNIVFAGHYATEVLGVKALAQHIEERFKLETVFLDIPTGL
jgi:dinuclear metal center YbgI/SA1388 family protein